MNIFLIMTVGFGIFSAYLMWSDFRERKNNIILKIIVYAVTVILISILIFIAKVDTFPYLKFAVGITLIATIVLDIKKEWF